MVSGIGRTRLGLYGVVAAATAMMMAEQHGHDVLTFSEDIDRPEPRKKPGGDVTTAESRQSRESIALVDWRGKQTREAARRLRQMQRRAEKNDSRSS